MEFARDLKRLEREKFGKVLVRGSLEIELPPPADRVKVREAKNEKLFSPERERERERRWEKKSEAKRREARRRKEELWDVGWYTWTLVSRDDRRREREKARQCCHRFWTTLTATYWRCTRTPEAEEAWQLGPRGAVTRRSAWRGNFSHERSVSLMMKNEWVESREEDCLKIGERDE